MCSYAKMLSYMHQMRQELGMGPKDPNYVNPFSRKEDMGKTEVCMYNVMHLMEGCPSSLLV